MFSKCVRKFVAKRGDNGLQSAECTVQSQRDQHEKENDRPKRRPLHGCNRLRINNEDQARTLVLRDIRDVALQHFRHVAQNRKNDETGEKTREAVDRGSYDCVSGKNSGFHKFSRQIFKRKRTGRFILQSILQSILLLGRLNARCMYSKDVEQSLLHTLVD